MVRVPAFHGCSCSTTHAGFLLHRIPGLQRCRDSGSSSSRISNSPTPVPPTKSSARQRRVQAEINIAAAHVHRWQVYEAGIRVVRHRLPTVRAMCAWPDVGFAIRDSVRRAVSTGLPVTLASTCVAQVTFVNGSAETSLPFFLIDDVEETVLRRMQDSLDGFFHRRRDRPERCPLSSCSPRFRQDWSGSATGTRRYRRQAQRLNTGTGCRHLPDFGYAGSTVRHCRCRCRPY